MQLWIPYHGYHLSLRYDSTEYRTQSPNGKAYLLFLHSFKEKLLSKGDFSMNFSIKESRFVNECNAQLALFCYDFSVTTHIDIFYHKNQMFYKTPNNSKKRSCDTGAKNFAEIHAILGKISDSIPQTHSSQIRFN